MTSQASSVNTLIIPQIDNNYNCSQTPDTEASLDTPFIINPDASPPTEKYDKLTKDYRKFKRVWERQSPDITGDSQAGYDYALAQFAHAAGWRTQQIIDLIMAHRRKHDIKGKFTKEAALGIIEQLEKQAAINLLLVDQSDDKAEQVLDHLSSMFGFRIERVVRTLGDPPTFRIEVEPGHTETKQERINIGSSNNILNQQAFTVLVADRTKVTLTEMGRSSWRKVARKLIGAAVDEDFGEELTDHGEIMRVLVDYLDRWKPATPDSEKFAEAILTKDPIIYNDKIYVNLDKLLDDTRSRWVDKIDRKRMIRLLGMVANPERLSIRRNNDNGHRMWGIKPAEYSVKRYRERIRDRQDMMAPSDDEGPVTSVGL